jgi:hypothetical protein
MVKNDGARAGGSSQLTLTFFLEGRFPWQKWRSKRQKRAISCSIPSVFQMVVLVRPREPSKIVTT